MNTRPPIFRAPKVQKILNAHAPSLMPRYLQPSLIWGLWAVVILLMSASGLILHTLWRTLFS